MPTTVPTIDEFTTAYIKALLWAENDESTPQGGRPLDDNYTIDDLAPEALAKCVADCQLFQRENAADLAARETDRGGIDLLLTRNRHGAGYWDGDWPDAEGTRLTAAADRLGEVSPYVVDGRIYL
jgi:hypothetical protein